VRVLLKFTANPNLAILENKKQKPESGCNTNKMKNQDQYKLVVQNLPKIKAEKDVLPYKETFKIDVF
jgi:hypothetical protein